MILQYNLSPQLGTSYDLKIARKKIRRKITPYRFVHKLKKYLKKKQRSYIKNRLIITKYDTARVLFIYVRFV
jgi:hypothetical protein